MWCNNTIIYLRLCVSVSSMCCSRVHISHVTASYLNGEFELEPGEGEMRDDGIRSAGIKTYLIKSVNKPVCKQTLIVTDIKMWFTNPTS